jgi:hypothetical protein
VRRSGCGCPHLEQHQTESLLNGKSLLRKIHSQISLPISGPLLGLAEFAEAYQIEADFKTRIVTGFNKVIKGSMK